MPIVEDNSVLTLWFNVLLLVCRYVHIVASMLLVGGIVFFEVVVPSAIGDLNDQQQLAIFAKARLVFRRIVRISVILLLLSGIYITLRRMHIYIESEFPAVITGRNAAPIPWALKTGVWWGAHVAAGLSAIVFAIYLVSGDRPPRHPISLLRLDIIVLLIVAFLATATREVDQIHQSRMLQFVRGQYPYLYRPVEPIGTPAAAPSDALPEQRETQEAQ